MIDQKRAKIKAPDFCRYPEKENCRGCKYSINPEMYDPGCRLENHTKEGEDDDPSCDD